MYLILLAALIGSDLNEGIRLSRNHDYEASEAIMSKIKEDGNQEYIFYRMINAHQLNDMEGARKWSDMLLNDWRDMPRRYRDLAEIIKYDVENWQKKPDDLGDISRDMKKIQDRLHNAKGGKETQKQQKAVLDRLAKMIKDIEDKQKADAEAMAAAEAEKRKKFETEELELTPPPDTIKPYDPMGTGKVDRRKVKEIAEMWGKLPEKERATALRELTRCLPPRDRAVIERYFQELQKKVRR